VNRHSHLGDFGRIGHPSDRFNHAAARERVRARTLLWIDGGAAGLGGITMLVLQAWLARLYDFPVNLVVFLGIANLTYATYSGTLAILATLGKWPRRPAINLLVLANLLWVIVCATVLVTVWPWASIFGRIHVAFESLFVGVLAFAEYRWVRPVLRR